MTEALSLYRRHRPRTFADVVGQEHIVRTLRNAVEQGKVHHAYLFVGSRGTGKTSMAKILAACLNCERGPTTEPCGECESCRAIAAATSLDVIELDAASNNSVDDIRDLREKVAYAPLSGRHKVYILDEAHMLSAQAWNAFLKTLEEPPPHTIFVLATTEAQKVLPTVVDRCHRFDFARPSGEQIAEVLRRTAGAEGIDLPEPAAALIARAATGSFRDALGTLEQLVTYSGTGIQLDDVLAVLGLADADLLFEAVDAVGAGDPAAALRAVARLGETGRDAGQFYRDLEAHARELLVVSALGEIPPELRSTDDRDARLAEQAERIGRDSVVRLLDLLARGLEALKAGAEPRVALELALVKAAAPELDPSARALLARVERLEAQLASPAPAPAPASPPDNGPPAAAAGGGTIAAAPQAEPELATAAAVALAEPAAEPGPDLDLDAVRELWPAVIDTVRADNAMLAALLDGARPAALEGADLSLAFPAAAAFLKRKAEDSANREALAAALHAVAGRRLRVAYVLSEEEDAEGPPALTVEEWVDRLKAEFDAEELPSEAGREEHG